MTVHCTHVQEVDRPSGCCPDDRESLQTNTHYMNQ